MFNLLKMNVRLSDTQRALLFKDDRFSCVLEAGKHSFWQFDQQINVEQYDITDMAGITLDERLRHIISLYPQQFEQHLRIVETTNQQMTLIYQRDVLQNILPPESAVAFWKAMPEVTLETIDISSDGRLPAAVTTELQQTQRQLLVQTKRSAINHFVVADHERALVYKDKQFIQVLSSGQYSYWDPMGTLSVDRVNVTDPLSLYADRALLQLVDQYPDAFADFVLSWETTENEVGLVYEKQVLRDVLSPGQQGMYWKTARPIDIRKQQINVDDQALDKDLARQLSNPREALLQQAVRTMVYHTEIADNHVGFLYMDGKIQQMLTAGAYSWWTFNRTIKVMHLDMRLQQMEINGQEILTKDRVSLRINLTANWQVSDAQKVVLELADHIGYLYSELQLALRAVVSTRTLDELLADKNLLNQDVLSMVSDKVSALGITLKTTGVKDIILPGEMKDILAQVVEAQKVAEANLIRRREETQATRSLHNTAKVMEGNPTLLRLKEMEILERITGRISNLNVYGGLDGVMKDMVRLDK